MPPTLTDDPVLTALRAEYQSKYSEANQIIGDPNATGPRLTRAEKLSDECLGLESRIAERTAEIERIAQVKGRLSQSGQWAGEPRRTLPFSASMGGVPVGHAARGQMGGDGVNEFSLTGFEGAGKTSYQYDRKSDHWEAFEESGAGTLGEKTWETIKQFEYKHAWRVYIRKGNKALDNQLPGLNLKILQEGLDDQGGVFAPAELLARIIGREPAPTLLRSLVTTLTTGRDKLVMPRLQYSADDIYTTAFRVTWTGEIPYDGTGNLEAVNDANLTGNIDIDVHTAMLTAPVTRNLIEDSAFPIQAWLESKLAQTIDITFEDMILNGCTTLATTAGAPMTQPIGILFGAATGNAESNTYPEVINSSLAPGIDYGSLIKAQAALAPQYEVDTTRWVMQKRSTWAALCELVDSQNRPLFTTGYNDSGMVGRRGRMLLGDPIILSQLMPPISTTNFPVIYGDLRGYFLAQRIGFSIQVLDQTRAKANQIELVGRIRFGGRPVEPWRIKVIKSNPT